MNIKLASFSLFIFAFGIILIYFTAEQHSKISPKCVSKKVQLGFNIILMFGVMMTIIPVVQLFCHSVCGCPQFDLWYKWIIVFTAVSLIASGGAVWNGLNTDSNCGKPSSKTTSNVKTFISTLVILCSVLIFILVILPLLIPKLKGFFNSSNSGQSSVEMTDINNQGSDISSHSSELSTNRTQSEHWIADKGLFGGYHCKKIDAKNITSDIKNRTAISKKACESLIELNKN